MNYRGQYDVYWETGLVFPFLSRFIVLFWVTETQIYRKLNISEVSVFFSLSRQSGHLKEYWSFSFCDDKLDGLLKIALNNIFIAQVLGNFYSELSRLLWYNSFKYRQNKHHIF